MANFIRSKASTAKTGLRKKTKIAGWVLPKQESSWAPAGTWTNADLDIAPPSLRTWTSLTILGYWMSDVISVQSWETGSSILAVGLTWREAIFAIVFGSCVMAVLMSLNGHTGAITHAPFPVIARSSFGFYLSYFPIVVRLITCLFWAAITNFYGISAVTQVIRAIWPSFMDMPNHIPESVGITSRDMVAYFVFWAIETPLLLIPPYKLRWFFVTKVVMTTATILGIVIWTCTKAHGSGDIWKQTASVSGAEKSWLTMWALNSCTASWFTVGVNIPDFTRYMKSPRSSWTQGIWFPSICSWVAIMGIVTTSASSVVFGTYLWDPVSIVATWDGPGGRAAAFFTGVSWCIAQMGVNISATVISGANDLTSLFPKYVNIRRGVIIQAIISGWVMVPWKIIKSADSLLSFLNSLGIFLGPILAIQITDFFIVKRRALDVPALYDPHGRYHYWYGINWRAAAALLIAIGPMLPGLIHAVNPSIPIGGAAYIADLNLYFGVIVCGSVYVTLNYFFPARETLVGHLIETNEQALEEVSDGVIEEKLDTKE